MKYIMMVKLNGNSQAGRDYETSAPPDPKLMAAVMKHAEKLAKAGVLLGTGGLLPSANGARVKAAGGKLAVTDGPFAESKELIGGYAILQAKSKEEAIQLGKDFMKLHVDILGPSYEAELEIRQMHDSMECGAEAAKP